MDMTMPQPRAEHAFLQKLVGRWQVSAEEMTDGEDWIEEVRSLNGIWFLAEGRGRMPGGAPATTLLTLGHDSRIFTSSAQQPDGGWQTFMRADYRRLA